MKITYKLLLLLGTLLCFTTSAFADELISAKLGYQLLTPNGSIAGNEGSVGLKLDVSDNLHLEDSEDFTAEVALQYGDLRLSLNYLPINFSGSGPLNATGTYNGQNFTSNEVASTDLTIDMYDVGLTYYLVNLDDLPARVQFGLELAVKVCDVDVAFNVPTAGINESDSVTAPIPTAGARFRVAISDLIGVVGRVGYMEYSGNHFADAEAQVEFSPLPMVGIYGGYRYFDLKVDEDDIYVETDFSGPFAGAMVRF